MAARERLNSLPFDLRSRRARARLGLALSLLAGPGCVQDDGTRFNPLDTIVGEMTVDDERETGMEVDQRGPSSKR